MLCAKFDWNQPSGYGEVKKVYRQTEGPADRWTDTDRQMDAGQIVIRVADLSFQLNWTNC